MTTQSSRSSSSLAEVFQANRVPIALIGVGVAWLLASNTGLTASTSYRYQVRAADADHPFWPALRRRGQRS